MSSEIFTKKFALFYMNIFRFSLMKKSASRLWIFLFMKIYSDSKKQGGKTFKIREIIQEIIDSQLVLITIEK